MMEIRGYIVARDFSARCYTTGFAPCPHLAMLVPCAGLALPENALESCGRATYRHSITLSARTVIVAWG